MTNSVCVHGHRGSRGTHPENIIASFEEARDAGCAFIELDVHLTRDDKVVVYHDFELSGKLCQDVSGQPLASPIHIRDLSLDEIKSYRCGGLTLPNFPDQTAVPHSSIPTLDEVIRWKLAEAPSLRLNIEIKREVPGLSKVPTAENLAEEVISLLRRYNLVDEALVQSFDHEVVRAARAIEPKLRLSCLFEHEADFAKTAVECNAQVAAPHFPLLNSQNVAACLASGIEVLPWTVNLAEDWQRLLSIGVRSIITDYPRKLVQYLRANG